MSALVRVCLLLSAALSCLPVGRALLAQSRPEQATPTVRERALAALLKDASDLNQVPPALQSYRADIETDVGVLFRRHDASERAWSLEQVASTLHWTRDGVTDQRIIGYREQQQGLASSMLTVYPTGWLTPVLYGNRLRLRSFFDSSTATSPADSRRSSDTIPAIHPLAADRDSFYTFSGGDTIVIIADGARRIPIVRVHVHPRRDVRSPVLLFEGDLALDASRGALVRIHGYILPAGFARLARQAARVLGAYAFVELENAEYEGKYWLPVMQRIELQVTAPLLTETRYVSRIVSRFTHVAVNDSTIDRASTTPDDSSRPRLARQLQWAPRSAVDRFDAWQFPFGAISADMHADDFGTVGPDFMRPSGSPRVDVSTQSGADLFRYNRVEGAFTGLGIKLSMRDAAPGVVARVTSGWAWTERTVRGRASIAVDRATWSVSARAGRSLDITNDFQRAIEPNLDMLGFDDAFDYVDRRSAGIVAERRLRRSRFLVRAELGVADDRDAPTRVDQRPFRGSPFRANRVVDEGSYTRSAAVLEWNPRAADLGTLPGVTGRLHYQRGDGTLAFNRLEARVIGRRYFGAFMAVGHGEGGIVGSSTIPPQRLFELARGRSLPGLDRSFAGSRALTARGSLLYTSPYFRRPTTTLFGTLRLPGAAPGIMVGVQGAWADAHSAAAQRALSRLGVVADSVNGPRPVARETDGVRASGSIGLRLFSGMLFLGVARPVGRSGPWRFTMSGGS